MANTDQHPWGRVDESGTVFVREGDSERVIGEYPDGTPEEAIAYFERKYADLAGQVTLLEQRVRRGIPAAEVTKTVASLRENVSHANALGDLASLSARLDALDAEVATLSERQHEQEQATLAEAIAERTAIVEQIEALAAADPAKAQWKQVTASIDSLFAQWQHHQQTTARLPKDVASALWKRFRDARTSLEQQRKAFFSELDAQHREAKQKKTALVERAEALVSQGADAAPAYRDLLNDWKAAGRAGKKVDDTLWERFKAAGDAIYAARSEVLAREDVEYSKNLEAKLELLTEAETILNEKDRVAAREKLSAIQRRWDQIGKVPRDKVREVEDRLRRVETAVRRLEDEHWQKSDPEKKARSEGLASQLSQAIERLESELTTARAAGDTKAVAEIEEALSARRVWLDALG